jgi:hypothetical protein
MVRYFPGRVVIVGSDVATMVARLSAGWRGRGGHVCGAPLGLSLPCPSVGLLCCSTRWRQQLSAASVAGPTLVVGPVGLPPPPMRCGFGVKLWWCCARRCWQWQRGGTSMATECAELRQRCPSVGATVAVVPACRIEHEQRRFVAPGESPI